MSNLRRASAPEAAPDSNRAEIAALEALDDRLGPYEVFTRISDMDAKALGTLGL